MPRKGDSAMSGKIRNALTWSDGILSMITIVVHAVSSIVDKWDDVRTKTSSAQMDKE